MAGFTYHVKRYFSFSRDEWTALFITAVVMGFVLSFNKWGATTFDLSVGVKNLLLALSASVALLIVHVGAQKLAGIYYGVKVAYGKYTIGLLVGVLVTLLSFGYLPLFFPGHLTYETIPNLRVGKFRAAMVKKWEIALIAFAGPLASLLLTIPFNLLQAATGLAVFHTLIVVSVLLAVFAMIPLPIIQTPNPYTVYMSRMESFEGSTPGFDIFFSSPSWYFFLAGLVVCFALLALLFGPSILAGVLALILGFGTMYGYVHLRNEEFR